MVYVSHLYPFIFFEFILFLYNYNKYNLIFNTLFGNCVRRLISVVYVRNLYSVLILFVIILNNKMNE